MAPRRGEAARAMKKVGEFIWPAIGLVAVVVSVWLLYNQLQDLKVADLWARLGAIPAWQYLLAALSTLVAYAALAWYDRIALLHLGVTHISWLFVSVCSFTTYALSHNIGASVFSGALVRYRAYTSKGLSAAQVAVLVALCSFTFALGTILLAGLVLTFQPEMFTRANLPEVLTHPTALRVAGLGLLAFVALYVVGSLLQLRPLTIRKFKIEYPRPAVMTRQLVAAPLELLGAAGIIYFCLADVPDVTFTAVLGAFLLSFSLALISHAPGGLGVFEAAFFAVMPNLAKPDLLAALLIFRLFYLLIPFAIAIVVVLLFERQRLAAAFREREAASPAQADAVPPAPITSTTTGAPVGPGSVPVKPQPAAPGE